MNWSGARLVRPMNAPAGVQVPPGVQPGTDNVVLARYVIVSGAGGGLFLYSGKPALGNPPIAWISAGTQDPYKNAITPGNFLAETASAGNAKGGLLWNTATPGAAEPLLALYPNATVGFTGNAPFVLGRVFNRGAVNELLALAFGAGGVAGSSPVMLELFSQSKDGTILGRVGLFDWASGNLILDINANGIVAANPGTPNTDETWHSLALTTVTASGNGVNGFRYKKYADNTVELQWDIAMNSVANNITIATLPVGWRPTVAQNVPSGTYGAAANITTAANPHFSVNTNGTIVTGGQPAVAIDMFGGFRLALD